MENEQSNEMESQKVPQESARRCIHYKESVLKIMMMKLWLHVLNSNVAILRSREHLRQLQQ